MSFYSTRPDGRSGISPRENMEYNLGECKAYAAKFSKDSPNLLLFGSNVYEAVFGRIVTTITRHGAAPPHTPQTDHSRRTVASGRADIHTLCVHAAV